MIGGITKLVGAIGGGLLGGVDKLVGRFKKNQDRLEGNIHGEQIATLEQFAAENAPRGNRTWWDSVIDGLNRLPRPTMAFLVVGILVYAPIDPEHFVRIMQAYTLVPEWLGVFLLAIAGFYFGSRHLEKRISMKGPDPARVRAVLDVQREVAAMNKGGASGPSGTSGARPPPPAPAEASAEDPSRPPNEVVDAWRQEEDDLYRD